MRADQPERIGVMLAGSHADRDAAAWRVCSEVARALASASPPEERAAYLPAPFHGPPQPWGEREHQAIQSCRAAKDFDALRLAVSVSPEAFGRFRLAVADWEIQQAGRLNPVLWSLQVLYRLADSGAIEGAAAYKMSVGLSSVVTREWHVGDWDITANTWDVAVKATRDYRLLPKSWRFV